MTDSIRPARPVTPVPDGHLRALVDMHKLDAMTPLVVVGIRGYVNQTPGDQDDGNKVGEYDDVICIVTPTRTKTFLGNTDPSRTLAGRAILVPQLYYLVPGIHNRSKPPAERRPAFIQDSPVTIRRYDAKGELGPEIPNQMIGCNLHDGSWTTTGSAACQTVAPEQWHPSFVDDCLTALGIPVEEWATVTARVKMGQPVPAHWSAARFPYILGA